MRVLLIEDDPDTSAYIVKGLEEERHTINHLVPRPICSRASSACSKS